MQINLTGAEFTLKHRDTSLLHYKVIEDSRAPVVEIQRVFPENSRFFPLGIDVTQPDMLSSWLCSRATAGRRAFTDVLLSRQNVDLSRPLHILGFTRGLSLNDVYWMEGKESRSFAEVNLYENGSALFDENSARISLTGSSHLTPAGGFSDIITGGNLPKAWIYRDRLYLYKSGAIMEGFGTRLMQPYSEYFAYTLALAMGLFAVPYGLDTLFDVVCSVCPLFTSPDIGFVSAATLRLLRNGGLDPLLDRVGGRSAYQDMRIFDYLAGNTDRHAANFGFLVRHATNEIISLAPIFDNGEGLYGRWVDAALEKLPVRVLPPDDAVQKNLMPRHLPLLQSLRNFQFQQHPTYHVPEARIEKMNIALQLRIDHLIALLEGGAVSV